MFETGLSAGQEPLYGTAAIILAALLLSLAVVFGVRERLPVFVFLLTVPIPLFGLFFSANPPFFYLLLLGFVWILLVVFSSVNARSGRFMSLPYKTGKLVIAVSLAAAIAVLVFFSLFSAYMPEDEYTTSGGASGLKAKAASQLDHLRYEKSGDITELPTGDMNNVQSLDFTYDNVLVVKLEKPRPLYLKGFIGSVYKDNRWGDLSAEAYAGDFSGIFAWLSRHDFYAQTQLGRVGAMTMGAQSGWFSVENLLLNSKYIYAPYELLPTQDLAFDQADYQKDVSIGGRGLFGARKYTFDMYLPVVEDYGSADLYYWLGSEVMESPAYKDYLQYEMVYRTFVYNTYLGVPEGESELLTEYFSPEAFDTLRRMDYRGVVREIRKLFNDYFTFSAEVEPAENESGFVAGFLQDGAGYDVHFATLAALILREAGIPARYAEGFFISPDDVAIYAETSSITFYLPDSSAHAWVEAYIDGLGWLPIEFTPGYFTLIKNENNNEGVIEVLKENASYFYMVDQEIPQEEEPPEEEPPEPLFPWRSLRLPLIVLLLILIYFSSRALHKKTLLRRLNQPDRRRAALAFYALLSGLLRFEGIRIEHSAAYYVLQAAGERYDFPGYTLKRFLDVVYKARFNSPERPPDYSEIDYLKDYMAAALPLVYSRQSNLRKILMRFIWLV